MIKKKISQPSQIKTCGSTFKNSRDKKAWELIKETGSNQFKEGDAIILRNITTFVNKGNAKSSDIENLFQEFENQ